MSLWSGRVNIEQFGRVIDLSGSLEEAMRTLEEKKKQCQHSEMVDSGYGFIRDYRVCAGCGFIEDSKLLPEHMYKPIDNILLD